MIEQNYKFSKNEIAIINEMFQERALDSINEKTDFQKLKRKILKYLKSDIKNEQSYTFDAQEYMIIDLFDMMQEAIIYSLSDDTTLKNSFESIIHEHYCKLIDNLDDFNKLSKEKRILLFLFYNASSFSANELLDFQKLNESEKNYIYKLRAILEKRSK
jgi:hypothetical protein